jgi:SagB-type dehydrogenase family enzyme
MTRHPEDTSASGIGTTTSSTEKNSSAIKSGRDSVTDKLLQLKSLDYMRDTRLSRQQIRHHTRPAIEPAPLFKQYRTAPRVSLPRDWPLAEARLSPLLQHRRSRRTFARDPLPLDALAYMLWAAQGITALAGNHPLRTAPSAGALYPVETYVSIQNVADLPPGLYHFNVADFELELMRSGSQADDLATACLNQGFLTRAAAVLIWTAVYRRNASKYGERGLRYVLLDAGHICQNTLLAAEATGACGCPVAAFFDEELNKLLGLDGVEESAIYLAGVGLKP